MDIVYLRLEDVIETHRRTVEVSGGGAMGHRDLGMIDSALTQIQNDDYYPSFIDKITHLFFACNKFHCFEDGNKRIAISAATQFLLANGYVFAASRFIIQMENISYHVAAAVINKDLLHELIEAAINDDLDDNEDLKIRLLEAMSQELPNGDQG